LYFRITQKVLVTSFKIQFYAVMCLALFYGSNKNGHNATLTFDHSSVTLRAIIDGSAHFVFLSDAV